jgi:hypothetical protein
MIITTHSEEVNPLKTIFFALSRVPALYEGHIAPEMYALSCTSVFLPVLFLSVARVEPCLRVVMLLRRNPYHFFFLYLFIYY